MNNTLHTLLKTAGLELAHSTKGAAEARARFEVYSHDGIALDAWDRARA